VGLFRIVSNILVVKSVVDLLLDEPLVPDDIARIVLEVATQPAHVLIPKVMVLPKHMAI
jgi:NADP-dependent 3-hydroxy acid dehydrogenase YdfG